MNPYIEIAGEIAKKSPICQAARFAILKLTHDGKAIGICRSGAWAMGGSRIAYVHMPDRVYSDMFEELVKLNNYKSEWADKFTQFSLECDKNLWEKRNSIDRTEDEKIEVIPGIGNKINYRQFKKLAESINGGIFNIYRTNIRPSTDTVYKGLAAHTLMREEVMDIDLKIFAGRLAYLYQLIYLENII